MFVKKFCLLRSFDAFRDNAQTKMLGHREYRFHQGSAV